MNMVLSKRSGIALSPQEDRIELKRAAMPAGLSTTLRHITLARQLLAPKAHRTDGYKSVYRVSMAGASRPRTFWEGSVE